MYVNLVSTGNSPLEFTANVSPPIDLTEGGWTVALRKIIYPNNFEDVTIQNEFIISDRHEQRSVKITINSKSLEDGVVKGKFFQLHKDYFLIDGRNFKVGSEYRCKMKYRGVLRIHTCNMTEPNFCKNSEVGHNNEPPLDTGDYIEEWWTLSDPSSRKIQTVAINTSDDIQKILTCINKDIKDFATFQFNVDKKRVTLQIKENKNYTYNMSISASLANILGFVDSTFSKTVEAENPISLLKDPSFIYICSDICKNEYVGDKIIPLLSYIPFQAPSNNMICFEFDNPVYIPIARGSVFSKINILLVGNENQKLVYNDTELKTILTLEFRRL